MTASPLGPPSMDLRRGACPALSAPMMTGDGLLARIALTDAISPAELAAISCLARQHGNGILDISARGNLQVRGLTETTAPDLDADIRDLNLPLRDGLAVEIPPLGGMDEAEITDPCPLSEAIRNGSRHLAGLAPKMSVVVDGHGRLRLSNLLADIRLVAVRVGDEIRWKILLGGTEKSGRVFDVLRETQAVEATLDLLHRLSERGPGARGRDLADGLPLNEFNAPCGPSLSHLPISALEGEIGGSMPHRLNKNSTHSMSRDASPFSSFRISENLHATGIAPAFGQAKAEDLIALCEHAAHLGIRFLKPAFDHSLLFFADQKACLALSAFASEASFITSTADPRSHIAACPGSPACASASIPTHEIATHAAAECGDLLDGSFRLHVTGCPKGCAHPEASALALCGTATGLSFIHQAKASGAPFASTGFANTSTTLRRLADLVKSERRPGENSAVCLARLGSGRLAATVMSGRP